MARREQRQKEPDIQSMESSHLAQLAGLAFQRFQLCSDHGRHTDTLATIRVSLLDPPCSVCAVQPILAAIHPTADERDAWSRS